MSPNCRKASEEGHLRAQVLESPGSPRCLSRCPGGPAHVTFSALHPGLTSTRLPLQAFCEFRTASSLKSLFCPQIRPLLKTVVAPSWTGSARSGDPPVAGHWPPQHPLSPGGGSPSVTGAEVRLHAPAASTLPSCLPDPLAGSWGWVGSDDSSLLSPQSSASHRRGSTYIGGHRNG